MIALWIYLLVAAVAFLPVWGMCALTHSVNRRGSAYTLLTAIKYSLGWLPMLVWVIYLWSSGEFED